MHKARVPRCTYFVSALVNGTTTGVLRQHALRLNSTSQCTNVSPSEFPSTCSVDRPFVTSYKSVSGDLQIRICAPGAFDTNPWFISRDRQDISEELWIDTAVALNVDWGGAVPLGNFTLHCTSSTTRGYFELGNAQNGFNHGPLLAKWPEPEDMEKNFNDVSGFASGGKPPSVMCVSPHHRPSLTLMLILFSSGIT